MIVLFYLLIAKGILYNIPIGEKIFLVWNECVYVRIKSIIITSKLYFSIWNFYINSTQGLGKFLTNSC